MTGAAYASAAGIIALVLLAGVSCGQGAPRLLVNESASIPRGVYLRRDDLTPEVGRLVAMAPPQATRSYLASLGVPADMRMLKRVSAARGETVCAEAGELRLVKQTRPILTRDRRGVSLPHWRGCRRLADDEVLLLGDTKESFDSRYFGPVRLDQIEGVYVEVFRW